MWQGEEEFLRLKQILFKVTMVIDLAEDPDKSTSGPAKLTEEVMGIMCRWVQDDQTDFLKLSNLNLNMGEEGFWVREQDGKLLLKLG